MTTAAARGGKSRGPVPSARAPGFLMGKRGQRPRRLPPPRGCGLVGGPWRRWSSQQLQPCPRVTVGSVSFQELRPNPGGGGGAPGLSSSGRAAHSRLWAGRRARVHCLPAHLWQQRCWRPPSGSTRSHVRKARARCGAGVPAAKGPKGVHGGSKSNCPSGALALPVVGVTRGHLLEVPAT